MKRAEKRKTEKRSENKQKAQLSQRNRATLYVSK